MTQLRPVLFVLMILLPLANASAQWLEVTGQAQIIGNDIDEARERAIKRAMSQAMLQSATTLDYQNQSHNGVLTDESIRLESKAKLDQTQILSESRSDDLLSVTIRTFLQPEFHSECAIINGRFSVTIPKVHVRHREQLVPGAMFDLDSALTRLLANTLNGEGHFAYANEKDDIRFDILSPGEGWVRSLAEKDHSQYLLTVTIDDATLDQPKLLFGYIHQDGARQIALEATLYDAFHQEAVWTQRYHGQGAWPYKPDEKANTASKRFWASDYGEELQRISLTMIRDINSYLACQPMKGRIVELNQDSVILDLGMRNGLLPGERLHVIQQQKQWGESSKLTVSVKQVKQQRAHAKFDGTAAVLGIQVGDWVQRTPK